MADDKNAPQVTPAAEGPQAGAAPGPAQPTGVIGKLINVISSIFMPFLGAFSAAGLMKAIAACCSSFGWLDTAGSTYIIINAIGDGLFQFLPLVIALTAADRFKCNKWISIAVAAFLCHPDIQALTTSFADAGGPVFFGIPVQLPGSGYLQSVIPIILAVYLQSWVEKPMAKLPETIRGLFGGMLTLLITSVVTLLVVGPVANLVADLVAQGLLWLFDAVPIVAGFVMGALWPVMIIFGLHWSLVPVIISNMATLGSDFILPVTAGSNFAIGAAVLAVLLKTRLPKLRSLCTETLFTVWIGGISEPAIYGVLLKYKRPFAMMLVGSGVCGAFVASFGMRINALITTSFVTLPALWGACGWQEVVGIALGMVVTFALTLLIGYSDAMAGEA